MLVLLVGSLTVALLQSPSAYADTCVSALEKYKDEYLEQNFAVGAARLRPPQEGLVARNETPLTGTCSSTPGGVCPQADPLSTVATAVDTEGLDFIPAECVRKSMAARPTEARRNYAFCTSENVGVFSCGKKKSLHRVPAPKVTDNYIDSTRVALALAARCLGEDPRALFSVFHHESRMQVNVGSESHDWGVGQIHIRTPDSKPKSVTDVRDEFERRYAQKPECQRFSQIMKFEGSKVMSPCTFSYSRLDTASAMPVNPLRSFLVAGGMLLENQRRLGEVLPDRVTGEVRRAILRYASFFAYNAGPYRVIACLENFVRDHKKFNYSDVDEFKKKFTTYLRNNLGRGIAKFNKNPQIRRERAETIAGYGEHVAEEIKSINLAAGTECAK